MASSNPKRTNKFWKEGEPFIWISGLGITLILLMGFVLIAVIFKNGMGAFWPAPLTQVVTEQGETFLGEINQINEDKEGNLTRYQLKIGNRDLYSLDFTWVKQADTKEQKYPENALSMERREHGNFYGYFKGVQSPLLTKEGGVELIEELQDLADNDFEQLHQLTAEIKTMAQEMGQMQQNLDKLKYQKAPEATLQQKTERLTSFKGKFQTLIDKQTASQQKADQHQVLLLYEGGEKSIALHEVVRYYEPNRMGVFSKSGIYISKIWELFFDEPRESNTEGGLFPAIIGTVFLILIMSIFSFPLGVIAAVYLKEYTKHGFLVQSIRIAVNNLAGIPSIVWGIFGLGFFVYIVGGSMDALFFPERSPTPTFGTGGILWASLTLALLTVPVVIVATEEALGAVPEDLRFASLAIGATKFQTLIKVILPMASPRIMTGFILAMSRAAGEVAPLMITGVVKLAPSLPIDGTFPFFHLERKFMHLGFHIYDVSFQSPNVEAAKPMVFVTTLLLLGIVIAMSSFSIYIRAKMKKRYASRAF